VVTDPIAVEILKNRVTLAGTPLRLPARERELLFAIAASRGPLSGARAAFAVWPELEDERGGNALWVTIHRLRKRFPGRSVVASTPEGYVIEPTVRVDVAEAADLADRLRRGNAGDADRTRALDILIEQAAEPGDAGDELPEYVALRARAAVERLSEALAHDALHVEDRRWALAVARAQWGLDPFNEEACERVMRASLDAGDRSAAIGTFRRHRRALRDELDLEPSDRLLELVQ
jgi:DNA-binding SARP family transcriptional activator